MSVMVAEFTTHQPETLSAKQAEVRLVTAKASAHFQEKPQRPNWVSENRARQESPY